MTVLLTAFAGATQIAVAMLLAMAVLFAVTLLTVTRLTGAAVFVGHWLSAMRAAFFVLAFGMAMTFATMTLATMTLATMTRATVTMLPVTMAVMRARMVATLPATIPMFATG
jgi:hypothetical protein